MEIAELTALPLADRLRAMEALWESPCLETPGKAPAPDWHAEVLSARTLDAGTESTSA